MNTIDYKSAGVDIDAANEALARISGEVKSTFTPHVLTDVGTFGAMIDLGRALKGYRHPVLVQSMDGVGTKMIVARMMNSYGTIGFDLLSATCNDIVVHGARPVTFLDYIASDKLKPEIIESIVSGIARACREVRVPLVGGETAEMPDTYRSGEHDLVGVITGVVERDHMITGNGIRPGDAILGLPSSGLHTNGYSLARKLFFELGNYCVNSRHPQLEKTVGETLLQPHLNYTNPILGLLQASISINGMAHITGGGFLDNIPRILPTGCAVQIRKGSWPQLPIFRIIQELGQLDEREMFRTFNMGIGLVMVVEPTVVLQIKHHLRDRFGQAVHEIGTVVKGDGKVIIR